jgi:hypothetical protein
MTQRILVTTECMDLIRAAAVLPFKQTAQRTKLGWELDLSDAVYEKLIRIRFPGETVSDTIIRALKTSEGPLS